MNLVNKPVETVAPLLVLLVAKLSAAQINWQPSNDLYQGATNADFVSTNGVSLLAVNPSDPDNGNVTLNGVNFLRADVADLQSGISANGITFSIGPDSFGDEMSSIAGPSVFADGDFDGDVDIFNVIAGASYGHATLIFSGLSIGDTYEIQVVTNDARNGRHNGYKLNLSDGLTDVPTSMANGTAGQAELDNRDNATGLGTASGDSIIGTFVADGTTQSFEVAGELDGAANRGRAQLNAIQIRKLPSLIEAENFTAMSGVVIEPNNGASTDSIGYLDNGDWAEYLINIPEPGTYRFSFSAATRTVGGTVEIVSGGMTLGTATIPNTSAWNNWQPFITHATFTNVGTQTIRLNFNGTHTSALYNLDSFGFELSDAIPILVGTTPKQTMRYGMDYERLWYWTGGLNSSERDLVAKWSVVDNDIDFIRVAINSGYELTEGDYNLSAYTNRIIPMMREMQEANPDIKFFASPRPLDEAMNNVAWQPYPQWITGSTGSNSNFSFDWEKCAEYLVRYIELMDSYGFEISYLDLTNEWNFVTATHVRDISGHLEVELAAKGLLMPQIIAPSAWSYQQGASWLSGAFTNARRNAIDISACHNTNKTGTAEDFVQRSHDVLGDHKEVWNTELHGWKSTSGANEVLTFSFMLEAINAGFSGLTGWLAIGTTNQGHSYILNPSGTPSRNVKYFIFNKLSNTSHRGQALDIDTPDELSHTTALIKDNLLTVWAINPGTSDVEVAFDLNGRVTTNQTIVKTRWHTALNVEGEVTTNISYDSEEIHTVIPAESLCCLEIPLDPPTGPMTRFEAEAFTAQAGANTEATSDLDGEINISHFGHGDWLSYEGVSLAENSYIRLRTARPMGRATPTIEIRRGSPTGALLGTIVVPISGDWQQWETLETQLTNAEGDYDLYLVVSSENPSSNSDLLNLNWLSLNLSEPDYDPITDDNLIFNLVSITNSGGANETLTFEAPFAGLGQIYQLQYSDGMGTSQWIDIESAQTGNRNSLNFVTTTPTGQPKRFYRLKVRLP